MKRTSEEEIRKKYTDGKHCVIVYPNTDWMINEYDNKLVKKRLNSMTRKLGVGAVEIGNNDYFVYEFETEEEARKFFFSFGEEYEAPYFVELYIEGEIMGENT